MWLLSELNAVVFMITEGQNMQKRGRTMLMTQVGTQ
jgi:hypothetical protein